MNQKNKFWIGIGVAVVAIILIAIAIGKSGSKKTGTTSATPTKPAYGIKQDAPAGQLVKSMPEQLIVDKEAGITASYQNSYESGTVLANAQFTSTDSISKVYNDYLNVLKTAKYKIITSKLSASLGTINASNLSSTVSVQIIKMNGKTNVVVNYLIR